MLLHRIHPFKYPSNQEVYAMSDNLRRYRAIRQALKQWYPGEPRGRLVQHLTSLAAFMSGIVGSNSRCSPKNLLPPDHACKVVICWPPLPKRRAPDGAGSPRRTTGGHCHVACARRTSPPQRLVSASFSMARRTVPTEGMRRNLQRTLGRFA
jgi:hypothetical protein